MIHGFLWCLFQSYHRVTKYETNDIKNTSRSNIVADPHRTYEFRCPIHGFVKLNAWERDIVDHWAFRRLRRIRQLAWTDYVYPGAMHTRFEHSLGVLQIATWLYDAITTNSKDVLQSELSYKSEGLQRQKQLVRLAALLHDVGHGPFSHASEKLMPKKDDGNRYKHEDYSAAIIRNILRDVIENHQMNNNCGFKADDIASLLEGSSKAASNILWRDIISGQMDADRMDYLLRDSYHIGVAYGKFDLHRLINTIRAIRPNKKTGPRFGITEGGWHAAEGLILARYFMFTQVYFHKTRVAYDVHLREVLKVLLPNGTFPRPVETELESYLEWDDWRVLGLLSNGKGGEHGKRLIDRNHFREVFHTPECPKHVDLQTLKEVLERLGKLLKAEAPATKSWYKMRERDIPIISESGQGTVTSLSDHSSVIGNMETNNQTLLYVDQKDLSKARNIVNTVTGDNHA